jgi:hypothetical protein
MTKRDLVLLIAAVALVGAGALALRFPVFIDAYDQWGWQVNCGNGFNANLTQATVADNGGVDPQAGTPTPAHTPPHDSAYVEQCQRALTVRRAWTVPLAGVGIVLLTAMTLVLLRQNSLAKEGLTARNTS